MTAVVMKVTHAMEHPNADALRLYKMEAPGFSETQIIANLENVYEAGDHVEVVFAGSTLKDGTTIRDAKVRGIPSYGMALGKTDLAVGTDVTDEHCRDDSVGGFRMQKWPSIESLFNVRRSMANAGTERTVTYAAKVKLDGTNVGIQVSRDGLVAAQSRTKVITLEDDNMSFAKWLEERRDYFSNLAGDKHMTIFGEWCGKGIQKGTSISQLDRKVFVVFAIQYGGVDGEPTVLDINPNSINKVLVNNPDDVFVLPWLDGKPFVVDFASREQMENAANKLNLLVDNIEVCDPWVKSVFGIEGVGEGLVAYPLPSCGTDMSSEEPILVDFFEYSDLVFKAKGEKHKVVKTKKPVQIDPEVAKSIEDFVQLFVTEARLEQILQNVELDPKNTGNFIKEFSMDVQKESVAELEASNLTWKQVVKDVSTAARQWFLGKCNTA